MQFKAYFKACSVQNLLLMTAVNAPSGQDYDETGSHLIPKRTHHQQQHQLCRKQAILSPTTWKAMKLTFVLLTAVLLQVHARGLSQTVSFSGRNVSLQQVMAAIERQTGYVFFGNTRLLREAQPVTLDVKNRPLLEVLKACMVNQPLDFEIENTTIVIKRKAEPVGPLLSHPEYGAFIRITGVVLNAENDQPLGGATIAIKQVQGSRGAAITDDNGRFELNAGMNQTLVISCIGYQSQLIRVVNGQPLTIRLKPQISGLSTVTVTASTGYQTISKERATGSYDVVDKSILGKRPVSNLSTSLQGLIPGLQGKENSDGTYNFLIRGTSSMYANSQPLIVVDGFPVTDSTFKTINPNDVESVTVLKDAAAASIWGARSANGVIVVTTKLARAGGLQIDLNAFTRISDRIDLNQVLTQANTPDFLKYEQLAWKNNWTLSPYGGAFADFQKSMTLAQEMLYAHDNGKLSDVGLSRGLDSLGKISNRSQIKNLLMQRPVLSQVNLSVSGGNEKLRSMASLLYEKNKDGYVGNGYNRYMFSFRNQYKPAKFLTFFLGASVQYSNETVSGATLDEIQGLSPYETLQNPDGTYSVNLQYNREQLATLPLNKFPYADWSYNLLREVRGRSFKNEDLNARIQAGVNVVILKGLSLDSKLQYEKTRTDYSRYYSEETFFARDYANFNVDYNATTQTINKQYVPKGGIETPYQVRPGVWYSNIQSESYVWRNQLNFDRTFAGRHTVTVIAGTEISQVEVNRRANPWLYGYSPATLQSSLPQYGYGSSVNPFKNILGQNGVTLPGGNAYLDWNLNRYVSFYGNASYTYNRKYTLSGSVRSDASNYITDDPSLRWSPFWSVGGMWNIRQENFMDDARWIDGLSIRATYGRNGNAEKSTSTKTLLSMSTSVSATTGTTTASVSSYGNPLLRWEKTTTTNLGMDFSFFRRKLTGKIDYYRKLGSDIVGIISLPTATGTTTAKFNNAKLENRGLEISLGTDVKIPGTPVRYSTSVTYAYNWNRVTDLYYPSIYGYDMLNGGFVQGKPVGAQWSYTYLGMKDGEPYVAGVKGVPNRFDDLALHNRGLGLQYLNYEGTRVPPHTLGWYSSFSAYRFSVNVLISGTLGGVYKNPIFNYATTVGGYKTSVDRFVADVFAGNPNIPSFPQANDPAVYRWDRYSQNLHGLFASSSYIECKEVTLDYLLPVKAARTLQTQSIRLYTQMRNLGLIYRANKQGYNPDWLPGTNRPLTSYVMGINVQF